MPVPFLDAINPDTNLPDTADVVILGGGMAGVATALYLAEAGVKVVVCEKGKISAEQSSRNWGWVRQMGRDAAELPLTMEALRLWKGIDEHFGIDTGFCQTGLTYVCQTKKEIQTFTDWKKIGDDAGLEMELLDAARLQKLLPGIAPQFTMGLHTPSDGRAEPGKAVPAMAGAAQHLGATVIENCAVRCLETAAGRVSGVVTERGTIRASSVLVAGGAWSRLFLGNHGINFPQLRILATAARVAGVQDVPHMPVGGGKFSFRESVDGGYVIALRLANIAPIMPDNFLLMFDYLPTLLRTWQELKLRVSMDFFRDLAVPRHWSGKDVTPFEKTRTLDPDPYKPFITKVQKLLKRAFPNFTDAELSHIWAGIMDATPDAVAAIGPVDALPGLYVASGFSGHGFGIGPGAGLLMSQIIRGVETCVDPAPFRFDRFGKKHKLRLQDAA